jgi:diadenosine tetraphosphate (Ap4A) HIT family hydrolase
MNNKDCLICDRITQIKENKNPYFVKELKTGYIVFGDNQFFKGYTLFLCKKHVNELHRLDPDFKKEFLNEMSCVAEAVFKTFKPQKLNYELLGNAEPHLHWHIFPRHKNDPLPNKPIWTIDENIRCNEKTKPKLNKIIRLKEMILANL